MSNESLFGLGLYDEFHRKKRLPDVSAEFMEIFNVGKHPTPQSLIIVLVGSRGSGKSNLAFVLCSLYWKRWKIPTYMVGLDRSSDFSAYVKERNIEYLHNLDDIIHAPKGSVVYVDEAVLAMYAKEAHLSVGRLAEKWLSISRHKDCILIVATQRPKGLYKVAREDADLEIFKAMTAGYILEKDMNPAIIHYGLEEELMNLDVTEAIIYSGKKIVSGLMNGFGKLYNIPLWEFWHDIRVSKMWGDLSLDSDIVDYDFYAEEAYKGGMEVNNTINQRATRAWLRKRHPDQDLTATQLGIIIDNIALLYREEGEKYEKREQIIPEVKGMGRKAYLLECFKQDIEAGYRLGNRKLTQKDFEIMKLHYEGMNQGQIGKQTGMGNQPRISSLIKSYNESRFGIYCELWYRKTMGDKRDIRGKAPSDVPDCIASDEKVYQIKHVDQTGKAYNVNVSEQCKPEIDYCRVNNIAFFTILVCNEAWEKSERTKIIDMSRIPNCVTFSEGEEN